MAESGSRQADASLQLVDRLATIRARARLLELALLGNSGMSIDEGTIATQDVAHDLDEIIAGSAYEREAAHPNTPPP